MPRNESICVYLGTVMAPILEMPVSFLMHTAGSICSAVEHCSEGLSKAAYGRLAVNCAFLAAGHYAKYGYMPTTREMLDTALDELARFDDESGVDWRDIPVTCHSHRLSKPGPRAALDRAA